MLAIPEACCVSYFLSCDTTAADKLAETGDRQFSSELHQRAWHYLPQTWRNSSKHVGYVHLLSKTGSCRYLFVSASVHATRQSTREVERVLLLKVLYVLPLSRSWHRSQSRSLESTATVDRSGHDRICFTLSKCLQSFVALAATDLVAPKWLRPH